MTIRIPHPRRGQAGAQPAWVWRCWPVPPPCPAAATQLVAANLTRLIGQSELIVSGTVAT